MSAEVLAEARCAGRTLQAVVGDMTSETVDAVVNAANAQLAHGGGLAGAIVEKGGDVIQEESDRLAPVPVGGAVATSAGRLPARWVIHAVGPVWGEGDEESLLRAAVRSSLDLAATLAARSVALPAISTGIFGYPKDEGTATIVDEAARWLAAHGAGPPELVRFVASDRLTAELFASAVKAQPAAGVSA